jgi:hypothetical protein
MPLKMPRPPILVAEKLERSEQELRGILGGNLEALLGHG